MKKVTILGCGFIGKNLVKRHLAQGDDVTVLDRNECPIEWNGIVKWIKGTLKSNENLVEALSNSDIIFHLISSTVPGDIIDENEEIINNVLDTINMLKLCVSHNVKNVIFISSASVYGVQTSLPISETASTNPISSHGIHKLTIEKYLQLFRYKHQLNCKILRLANPFGLYQNIFARQGFIAICLGKILREEEIIILGDGEAVRDFIHIDDVVNACGLLIEAQTSEYLFNIGSGKGITINQVLRELAVFFGNSFKIKYAQGRPNDISESILDISKAHQQFGFTPHNSFNEGIKKTLDGYISEIPKLSEFLLDEFKK